MAELPPRASYGKREGRASVNVSLRGDTVVIRASCDSLRLLVEHYERTSSLWRERYGEVASLYETEAKRRTAPLQTFCLGVAAGVLASALTVIIIKKRKRND